MKMKLLVNPINNKILTISGNALFVNSTSDLEITTTTSITQEQYDALSVKVEDTLYLITGTGGYVRAYLGKTPLYKIIKTEKREEETATGILPLTFTTLDSGIVISLIRYGKCEQASTPTSNSPVDIVCNNGALKMVDDELPSGYKRILGIDFDGNFYYNTEEKLYGSDDITITLADTSTSGQNVFGAYSGTSAGNKNYSLYVYGNGSNSLSYLRYGETLLRPKFGTGQRTLIYGSNGVSGFATNVSITPDTFESTADAYIGHLPNSNSSKYAGNIVGNILVGTRLKFIPCERVSDGEIGYYEKSEERFIAKTGTGTPVSLGYDYSHFVVKAVGTPEILSLFLSTIIVADDIVDGYGLNSSSGVRTSNASRCYTCLGYFPAGTLIIVRAKMSNLGGYLYMYSSDQQPSSQTFIESTSMTAAEDIGGEWYERTGVSTSAGYLFVQCTVNKTTALENLWTAIKPSGTSASVADLLGVGDFKDEQDIISGSVTREVGIKVLNGTESVSASGAGWAIGIADKLRSKLTLFCTHYPYSSATMANAPDKSIVSFASQNIGIKDSSFTSASDVTTWLTTQYAAGTPVIVIYPLATETTESTTPQSLETAQGNNVVVSTANVSSPQITITYQK